MVAPTEKPTSSTGIRFGPRKSLHDPGGDGLCGTLDSLHGLLRGTVQHVEVCVEHWTFRMDGTMSAWNIMGRPPTFEGLYCPPPVFVQGLLPWTNAGCHEPNQGL